MQNNRILNVIKNAIKQDFLKKQQLDGITDNASG